MRFPARSVILSVGSPALAAYTLAITSLNTRLVCRRAQRTKYECTDAVTKALVSLQQAPFHLTRDDRLLAFVSSPDTWTREIDRLSWSVTAGSSVAWVIISFAFTLVDSFLSPADHPSRGHAVGTLWLWLLCLVVCWLWVPVFTREELRSAIGHANQNQVKESDPLPDTTHHQFTDSSQLPAEDPRDGPSTSANPTPDHNSASLPLLADTHPAAAQSANDTEQWGLLTPKMDSGSLTRDELRFGPTFNYSRIILYFALVDDVFWALEKLARDKEEVGFSRQSLIIGVISLTFCRKLISPLPLLGLRRLSSLRECSPRCSPHQFLPLSSSAGQRPQLRLSYFTPLQSAWGAVLWDTSSTEGWLF